MLTDAEVDELVDIALADSACAPAPPEPAADATSEVWGVVGYRHFTDEAKAFGELDRLVAARGKPARVVSGGAKGADALAEKWAAARDIALTVHTPVGANADGIAPARELLARNTLIARDCTLLVAFLSPASRGTLDTIKKAGQFGKEKVIIKV